MNDIDLALLASKLDSLERDCQTIQTFIKQISNGTERRFDPTKGAGKDNRTRKSKSTRIIS